jgi:hypothetical protein
MRYFLHIRRDGRIIADREGSNHADLTGAHDEALLAAKEILANAILEGTDIASDAILIADESGRELATVSIASLLPDKLKQKPQLN